MGKQTRHILELVVSNAFRTQAYPKAPYEAMSWIVVVEWLHYALSNGSCNLEHFKTCCH